MMKHSKFMAPLLIALSGLALAAPPADSAERPGPKQGQGRMKNQLGLSEEQLEQMREIRRNGGSREEFRAILTEEQLVKLDQMRENMRARHPRKGQKGRWGGRPDSEPEASTEPEASSEADKPAEPDPGG